MREERPRRSAIGARRGSESVELCAVGDEQLGGVGVEVEGAVVTEGEDYHGGAIEGGEGGEGGVEHSRERINEVGNGGARGVCFRDLSALWNVGAVAVAVNIVMSSARTLIDGLSAAVVVGTDRVV